MKEIIAIKILSGNNTAIAIEKQSCHYMELGGLDMNDLTKQLGNTYNRKPSPYEVPGIWYKPDAEKWHFPIQELDIFVPMTAIVSIAFK